MLSQIFPRNNHSRQHSSFTGASITTSGSLTTKTRPLKGKGRKRTSKGKANGSNSEDSHSHHSESSADDESNSSLVSVKAGLSKCCVQGTLASRRWQMFQMILLPFIPIVALIVQNSSLLSTVIANMREAGEIKHQIGMIVQIGKLLAELQQERADFGYCLFTNESSFQPPSLSLNSLPPRSTGSSINPEPITDQLEALLSTISSSLSAAIPTELMLTGRVSVCRETLRTRFQRTDYVIQNLSDYVANYVPTVNSISDKRQRVFLFTSENSGATDDTALDELIWYNVANDVILELLNQRIRNTKSTGAWKPLIAYMNMIRAIENYSISMVYGLYYFGKGKLSQNSFNKYIQYDSLAADYLNSTKSFSPEIASLWETYIGLTWKSGFDSLVERRATIYRNIAVESAANSSAAKVYYANMTTYITELRGFQYRLRELIDEQVTDELRVARTKQAVAGLLLAIVLGISPIIIILVRKVTTTIQTFSLELGTKTSQLKREKRRSDKLLKQMLPAEVIRQLKKNKQVPAENFECVTIYFSDIVSFTKLSSTSSPMEIIVMLNSLYKLFDSKIELYDVYKVETIGDAYMVVSGLPLRNANRHAGEICTMALDLIAGVKQFQIPHRPGTPLQIRVGINSGPCVAGVVGTKMPRYCLFGDAINVASRMESHGESMKIHVTEHTKQLLDELGGYILDSRGILEIKCSSSEPQGKGTMTTYWLLDKEGGLPKKEVELSIPGFFKPLKDNTPEFLHEIFGSSESDDGADFVKLQVTNLRHPPAPHESAINVTSNTNSKIPLGMLKHA